MSITLKIDCPRCGYHIKTTQAAELGKLAKGKKKNFTPEELEKRKKRMLKMWSDRRKAAQAK